jgi:hypothetical protein
MTMIERTRVEAGLRLLWSWYPLPGLIGFTITGIAFTLGKVPVLVPLFFWLLMAVWVWQRFRAKDRARQIDQERSSDDS